MLSCGIPELSDLEDLKYVYDALRPQDTEANATTYFTRYMQHKPVLTSQVVHRLPGWQEQAGQWERLSPNVSARAVICYPGFALIITLFLSAF